MCTFNINSGMCNSNSNVMEDSKMVNVNGVSKVERYNAYLEKLEVVRNVYSSGFSTGIVIEFDAGKGYITFVDKSLDSRFDSGYFSDIKIKVAVGNVWDMLCLYNAISSLISDKQHWVKLLNKLLKEDDAKDYSTLRRSKLEFPELIKAYGNWSGSMIAFFENLLKKIDISITGYIANELQRMDLFTQYGLVCSSDVPEYMEYCEYKEF